MKSRDYTFKILFMILFLGLGMGAETFAGENPNQIVQLQKDSLNANTVCYEVFGMDCPGCQSALEKQIKKIDGVANAKASYKNKEVVITLKPNAKAKEEEIHSRIKKANFTPGKKKEPKKDE